MNRVAAAVALYVLALVVGFYAAGRSLIAYTWIVLATVMSGCAVALLARRRVANASNPVAVLAEPVPQGLALPVVASGESTVAARDRRIADAFQRASLPARLPELPGVRLSVAYRAHRGEAAVGGDWYDAFRLADGRLVLAIGDVAGSGLSAAVAMSALRHAMRGAAYAVAEPAAILAAVERALHDDAPTRIATAFAAVFDPVTRKLTYASAGHPPPLLRHPSGNISELRGPGLPLGARAGGAFEARDVIIDAGSFLVLYTDGLVEATRDLPQGERRLREALANIDLATGDPAAAVVARALPGGAADDVAVLALAVDGGVDDPRYRTWTFDVSDRFAAHDARAGFTASLVAFGAEERHLVDAATVFSELLGNVVRHARGPVDIVLDAFGPSPVLSVLDRGPGCSSEVPHLPGALAESGRGLFIVASLTSGFAIEPRPLGGTHVRTVLSIATAAPAA